MQSRFLSSIHISERERIKERERARRKAGREGGNVRLRESNDLTVFTLGG